MHNIHVVQMSGINLTISYKKYVKLIRQLNKTYQYIIIVLDFLKYNYFHPSQLYIFKNSSETMQTEMFLWSYLTAAAIHTTVNVINTFFLFKFNNVINR